MTDDEIARFIPLVNEAFEPQPESDGEKPV
jgi:hypothetical protein